MEKEIEVGNKTWRKIRVFLIRLFLVLFTMTALRLDGKVGQDIINILGCAFLWLIATQLITNSKS